MSNHTILKVLVGSQAHGLATESSDYDYRAVFVQPTSEILALGSKAVSSQWIEGEVDNTAYEIGHFLHLATKSNPTILETFVAPCGPAGFAGEEGRRLREMFPYVWDSQAVLNAFTGYGYNQRKKFLDEKDGRGSKYAVAWLRTLIMADQMFTQGTIPTLCLADHPEYDRLKRWKAGGWELGEVMEVTKDWLARVNATFEAAPKRKPDLERVNRYLLSVRQHHWGRTS